MRVPSIGLRGLRLAFLLCIPGAAMPPVRETRAVDASGSVSRVEVAVKSARVRQQSHTKRLALAVDAAGSIAAVASDAALPAIEGLENNAPFPGPEAGDREVRSKIWSPVAGADSSRLHGHLANRTDGSCCRFPQGPRVELRALSPEELEEAHRGFGFNTRMSDSIDVDRTQSDKRSSQCIAKHQQYPGDLPEASVVIIFHNEHLATLLRTLHSILNTSPPRYLREIILVDDASVPMPDQGLRSFDRKRWDQLQAPLEEYIQGLPKVRLVRLAKRRGLMGARMEGIWRAEGAVTVFFDSHVEATPGWLEPMLARIKGDRKRVVSPRIEGIDINTFDYLYGGVGLMGFTWGLKERCLSHGEGSTDEPEPSPIMAGGLFAADRAYFLHLGGYDTNMTTWGGEEVEIGFRTWQCGGSLELQPCSHVGHLYRHGQPSYNRPGDEVRRNRLRVAEVWMDDYQPLMHLASPPLSSKMTVGSVETRKALRQKLGCRSFEWYLDHMRQLVPQMPIYAPKVSASSNMGALTNSHFQACVDTFEHAGSGVGDELFGINRCSGRHGSQAFFDEGGGEVHTALSSFTHCLGTNASQHLVLVPCTMGSASESMFTWDATGERLRIGNQTCLTATSSTTAVLAECEKGSVGQQWRWAAP